MKSMRLTLRLPFANLICGSYWSRLSLITIRGYGSSTPNKTARLPATPARTRFAPSPTGSLHLGSIRTALYNYLLAKRTNGQFILRIEDTDQKRTVPGAEDRLLDDLEWAGLQWDEGPVVGGPYGPYRQSERLHLYNTHIQTLLDNKSAYRCFCSTERLDTANRLRHGRGLPLGYDRKCADIPQDEAGARVEDGESHVIRFRVPKQYPKYDDLVYGKSGHGDAKGKQHLAEEPVFDDPILIKADGYPTYHFANVVDDKLMQITHVIRGSEWISSTPLHVALYEAFKWAPPQFGHVPLLVDHNRQKLSKRDLRSDLAGLRTKQGIFPETLTNFAALLGWSHQQKSDVLDLKKLEGIFDLKITRGNTIVAFEKLDFLQDKHARSRISQAGEPMEQMIRDVAVELLDLYGATTITKLIAKRRLHDVIAALLKVESLPYLNPTQFAQHFDVFLQPHNLKTCEPLTTAVPEINLYNELSIAASTIFTVPESHWTRETLRDHLRHMNLSAEVDPPSQELRKLRSKSLYKFLRWALLGGAQGPDIPATLEVLGRDTAQTRIREAILLAREAQNEHSPASIVVRRVPKGQGNSNKSALMNWEAHRLPGGKRV